MKTQLIALAALVLATTAHAQQAPKPEQLIKWRQSAYQTIAWNTARVKANVDGSYNKDDAARAAAVIAALANSNLGVLFQAGTDTGKGWRDTTVKANLFTDAAGVGEKAAAFTKEANELARLTQAGDVAAVKAQLAALQKTCKACHDDYRNN
ncbi:MAG: cytochrome c [Proteobacteria bacterium]|jgi:cytochrome c556|uniref:c-type cytochrome n=2 Tax=Pseudomonadota TaxID=1224 RepID=UPI000FA79EFB|nr:cytochrome C [Methylibium sp.]MBY0366514.1 cytochrome c [Burkholderiaceae bacterium]MCH8856954.1 cytochrome c [Pseudomonadota bacterium]RTL24891.1 MAG: cytochrome c [Burkholderiales bacterium]|mmetsp:Transcript_41603/g.97658  ORF Transcript_41603/g.97658 Transcript_41603/m.97658 type:complete len:152 (+) Transcript_41603:615-1070(+)